ncbi:VOC family protein [Listeria rocourtiae]|uniref:VOC family protein n=1 Tax=Listeria rocourtiae TaxID=647910 RepID=UPI003D2F6363
MKSLGIHHVSSLVADIRVSFKFYHKVLGMKLLMKTVNQDDYTMYHLFFADEQGRPGTEFTVFQINTFKKNVFGTNAIDRTVFSVKSEKALHYWLERFNVNNVEHCGIEDYGDTKIIRFEDPDGMPLALSIASQVEGDFAPNHDSDVPLDYAIIGIHSVHLRVRYPDATETILVGWFHFERLALLTNEPFPVTVLRNHHSDYQHEVHLIEDDTNPVEDQGIGGIHHLALYVEDYADLIAINNKLIEKNFRNSGLHPREFFDAIYFREPNGLLFEVSAKIKKVPLSISADEIDDVPLYLPDFLQNKREGIEKELCKIDKFRYEAE